MEDRIKDRITPERLERYFSITERALAVARGAPVRDARAQEVLDMAGRYLADAHHFAAAGRVVLAYAAINYAHGWLDAGARLGLYEVHDSTLFTVD